MPTTITTTIDVSSSQVNRTLHAVGFVPGHEPYYANSDTIPDLHLISDNSSWTIERNDWYPRPFDWNNNQPPPGLFPNPPGYQSLLYFGSEATVNVPDPGPTYTCSKAYFVFSAAYSGSGFNVSGYYFRYYGGISPRASSMSAPTVFVMWPGETPYGPINYDSSAVLSLVRNPATPMSPRLLYPQLNANWNTAWTDYQTGSTSANAAYVEQYRGTSTQLRIGGVNQSDCYPPDPPMGGPPSVVINDSLGFSSLVLVTEWIEQIPPPIPTSSGGYSMRCDCYESRFGTVTVAAWFNASNNGTKQLYIGRHLNPLKNEGTGSGSTDGWDVYPYITVDARSSLGIWFLPDGRLCISFDTYASSDTSSPALPKVIVSKEMGRSGTWSAPSTLNAASQMLSVGRGQHSQANTFKLRIG